MQYGTFGTESSDFGRAWRFRIPLQMTGRTSKFSSFQAGRESLDDMLKDPRGP